MGGEEWVPEWMKSITGRNKQFEKLGSREGRNANNHQCLEHRLIPRNPQFRSREPPREILSCVVIHMNEIVVRFRRGRLESINRTRNPLFLT